MIKSKAANSYRTGVEANPQIRESQVRAFSNLSEQKSSSRIVGEASGIIRENSVAALSAGR